VSAKSLTIIDKASPIPAELQPLFDDPPVLSTENSSQYRSLLDQIAKCVKPNDVIEWLWVRDIVDLSWEIRRLRRFKSLFIELARQKRISDFGAHRRGPFVPAVLIEVSGERMSATGEPISKGKVKKTRKRKPKLDTESDSASLFQECIGDYQCVDRLLAAAEGRRNAALYEIELRRDSLARRLRKATEEIIDADFNETPFAAE
jgi:hypothetical protein